MPLNDDDAKHWRERAEALAQQLFDSEAQREADRLRVVGLQESIDRCALRVQALAQQLQQAQEREARVVLALKANGRIDSPEVARVLDTLNEQLQQAQAECAVVKTHRELFVQRMEKAEAELQQVKDQLTKLVERWRDMLPFGCAGELEALTMND